MPETATTNETKSSRYLSAGSPRTCFLPSCRKPFEQSCVRGKDEHFYCSPACAEIGGKLDLGRVEELRTALPAPREKLFRKG